MTELADRLHTLSPQRQELLQRLLNRHTGSGRARITPRVGDGPAPASDAQYQLWITDQIGQGGARYNVSYAVRITGPVDLDRIARALTLTRQRHEILRTSLRWDGDTLAQIVDPDPTVLPRIVDLTDRPAAQRLDAAVAFATAEAAVPIDLATEPALRAVVYRLDERDVVLLAVVHHIATDAWSAGIFVRELLAGYQAADCATHPLPAPVIQYGDYAAWQRSPEHQHQIDTQLDYWRHQLAGLPDPLELPTDRPRRATGGDRHGARHATTLDAALIERVTARAGDLGATLPNVLYAAVAVVLSRYTGTRDLVLGTSVANRTTVETEDLIGYFATTLPIRVDLSGQPTLADAVVRTRDAMRGMADHQDVPFQRLVTQALPDRDPERNPLFQVMLVYQNVPTEPLALDDLTVAPVEIHNASAKFDLDISMSERDGGVMIGVEYDIDLYDAARIERLLGHVRQVLLDIAVTPQRLVRDATLLTDTEHATITDTWNATATPFPDVCLHELFEEWVDRAPDAPAVILGDETWTYRQVEEQANQFAARLRALGVGPNVRVAIAAERSVALVTGLLAISKAGGAYLPLDPAYPLDRLEFMLADGDARVLLCQPHLRAKLPAVTIPVITMDGDDPVLPGGRVPCAVEPTDLAYVIYTSGSTGRPKAVLADHRGRVSNFTDFNTRFAVGPGDRLLGLSSLSFDMCAYDVFGTLAAGACLVLPTQDRLRDPRDWGRLMRHHQITLWHSVPALLGLLVDHLERVPGPRLDCRLVLLGGDWIPLDLPDRIRAHCPPVVEVISLGGATEVSMDSTIYLVDTVDPAWSSIPYGAPMANQLAYVLDPDGSLLPEGVPGELALGGVGVAWGYHDRPALTAEKFTPNPYTGRPGDRLYHTGDIARWRQDGTLELIGRIDNQVKIRGYRIELGEIAAAHRDHPAVAEAVVVARKQGAAHRVVAYLVLAEGRTEQDLAGLAELLADRLPEYMIPSDQVVLDRLPLTPNGKIDRKALPEPATQAAPDEDHVAPATPTERTLAALWGELLGIERVSARANFFTHGGDSVTAIQLVSRAGERGLELTARQVFEHQTLDALATAIDTTTPAEPSSGASSGEGGAVADGQPSPMQRRMLASHRDAHFPGLYVIRSAIPLPGDIDETAFRAAWQLLIDRHETLRLRFTRTDGTDRVQVVQSAAPDLQVLDWRELTEQDQESRIQQLIEDECATLTPDTDTPLRLRLVRLDPSCTLFLQLNHYLLLDGWSSARLTSELLRTYLAIVGGTEPDLPPTTPTQSYLDWCAAQNTEATAEYWRQRLGDLPTPTPVFGDEVQRCTSGYAKTALPLGQDRMGRLRKAAEGERVTVNALLLAAWATVLAERTGHGEGNGTDVLFGLTTATRPAAVSDVESVAGLLINVLPLRAHVDPTASWSTLARTVQLGQLADAEYPLLTPELLAELPAARYDHVLVFDNYPIDDVLKLANNTLRPSHPVARQDFDVNQMEIPLRVDVALGTSDALIFSYDPTFADAAEIAVLAGQVLAAVDQVIADPQAPIRA